MKTQKKLISILLVAALLITTLVVVSVPASAATGTLASYYKTNPDGKVGKQATITIDGNASDWSEDMMIAQGAAWDCPNHWKGSHENSLADCYALFAAYDSTNLYIGMQFVNTTDTWQNAGDQSLMDNGKMGSVPIVLGLSVDPNSKGMTGKLATPENGKSGIWGVESTFQTHVDHLFFMSAKIGDGGTPAMFTADSNGTTDYTTHCTSFTQAGITYNMADTNICSHIWGLNYSDSTDDVYSDSADWVDYKTFTGSKGKHDTKYDSFYEMKIPLSAIGTTATNIANNGIGAIFFGTRNESMLDCVPFDAASMLDNTMQEYHAGDNTSKEKEDDDLITVPLARIGKGGSTPVIVTDPTTTTEPTTSPEPVGTTLKVNSKSNMFQTSSESDLEVGDTVTVSYNLTSNKKINSADWSLAYDSSKLKLNTAGADLCPVSGDTVNDSGNPVYGNFTDSDNPADFTAGGAFVEAEFEVLAPGTTDVTLTVNEMNYLNGTSVVSIVDNGVVQTSSGATVTATSETASGQTIDGLLVNGKSNFFDPASTTFDKNVNKVTVAYKFKASKSVINSTWKLTYDSKKLSLDSVSMPKAPSASFNTNTAGLVEGTFTDADLVSFSSMDNFVLATFSVLGTGKTTVNLNVIDLGIGVVVSGDMKTADLVQDGVVKDITSQSGFSGFTYSTETEVRVGFLLGDANKDGKLSVLDPTALQRYFAEYRTLNSIDPIAGDANQDGYLSIRDVTQLQRMLAEIA